MQGVARSPILAVVSQHVDEAAGLHGTRAHLVSAPHVKLSQLGGLDARLVAHLDGVSVAGTFGAQLADTALEVPGIGQVFVATVGALLSREPRRLEKPLSLVERSSAARKGLASAFGWVPADALKGIVSDLLSSSEPARQLAGISACALHRVDAGAALNAAVAASDIPLRARSLRCSGEIGRRDLLGACLERPRDEDRIAGFWAAWSAALLGDRAASLESLHRIGVEPGPYQERALQLALRILDNEWAHSLLKALAQNPANQRALLQGAGITGDPHYVLWLIKQMEDPTLARLAGESFSFITGLDLGHVELERSAPEDVDSGPNEDPKDENVEMDPDDGLPWPDPIKIQEWWGANSHRFQPGARHFMGEPVNIDNCKRVLRDGYQRQRRAAALYLTLLQPGTPLFNTSAPAWRQQRLLAKMS